MVKEYMPTQYFLYPLHTQRHCATFQLSMPYSFCWRMMSERVDYAFISLGNHRCKQTLVITGNTNLEPVRCPLLLILIDQYYILKILSASLKCFLLQPLLKIWCWFEEIIGCLFGWTVCLKKIWELIQLIYLSTEN